MSLKIPMTIARSGECGSLAQSDVLSRLISYDLLRFLVNPFDFFLNIDLIASCVPRIRGVQLLYNYKDPGKLNLAIKR